MDEDKLSISPSNKLFFAAAVAVCAIACAGSAVLAQEGHTMIAIEKMDVGVGARGLRFWADRPRPARTMGRHPRRQCDRRPRHRAIEHRPDRLSFPACDL